MNNAQIIQNPWTVRGIVFLRISFGLWFLYHEAWEKIEMWNVNTLPKTFDMWAKSPIGYHWYQSILTNYVIPYADFFRYLITSWEFILGICLVLGLGIRIVSLLQIFANVNYILAKTYAVGGSNLDRLAIIIFVTLFLVSAGRVFGLDGWLRRKFSKLSWL